MQQDPPTHAERTSGLDARLEAEIAAALGNMSIDDMLEAPQTPQLRPAGAEEAPADAASAPARRNDRASRGPARGARGRGGGRESGRLSREGTVRAIHGDDVMVEFDPRTQGICKLMHFAEKPALGQSFEFMLDRYDSDDKLWVLSRRGQVQKAEWESLEVGQVVEARCTGMNKGGLEMEVANHKAFMPAGQVDVRHIADLSVFIGQKMPCEVVEVDRNKARIILSRKSIKKAEREEMRQKLLAELEPGKTLDAVITSVQPYGAFADLGGIDGLIHVSDLSHNRIKHASEVVKEGDQVRVTVLKVNLDQDPPRISLGMKQLQDDPYVTQASQIKPGDSVTGRVTKIMAFGAFVELAPGVEGLIHISELSHDRVHSVGKVVKPDEVVTVKVLSIDPESRRISLSLKALKEQKMMEAPPPRKEDPELARRKALLMAKFGGKLKGGLG
jgi:small subunit ribosomal protein S1